jgi:hypothetical protein
MLGGRWLTQDELERRLAILTPKQRQELYGRYIQAAGWPARREVYDEGFDSVHAAQQRALLDSLYVGADSLTGHRRVIDLLVRQLGEIRAALPLKLQATGLGHETADLLARFDLRARVWTAMLETEGYHVRIPGVSR